MLARPRGPGCLPFAALENHRARLDGLDERLERAEGAVADQHLAGLGRLLQARGDVDGVAGDQEVAA